MKKILVPTDFSENALSAVRYALALATASQSAVHIVHALSASKKAGHFSSVEDIILEEKEQELNKLLAELRPSLPENLPLTGAIQQDYVVDALIAEADAIKADYIVMGTEGASGLKKWLVGSTTNALIKNTTLPVLAVPASSKPFAIDRICLALDLSKPINSAALKPLLFLAQQFKAQLDLLEVRLDANAGLPQIHPSVEAELKLMSIKYRAYKTTAKQTSEIDDAILDFAKTSNADLVCILNQSEQRSWWQNLFHTSVSAEIAYQTTLPLLVLHI